jgi:type I restriction enzyme S subunit
MAAEWTQTTLGDLVRDIGGEIKTGPFGTRLKASEYSDQGAPVVSVREVQVGRIVVDDKTPRVPESVQRRMPEYLLRTGDIVFARKGTIDRSACVPEGQEGFFLGSDGIRVRLPPEIEPRFVAYQVQTSRLRRWLEQHSTGSTMASLNGGILSLIPLTLPPLAEQRRIAAVLGALDDKIELNRKMNETLEATAQAIFQSWFIDFDGVPAEDLVESELGPIPRGWEVCKLVEATEAIVDCLHSKKPDELPDGNIMVQVFNVGDSGRMKWNKFYKVSARDHAEWCKRIKPRKGDIFVTKTGRVGAVAQMSEDLDVSFGRNLVVVRPSERLPANLLRLTMLSRSLRKEITRLTSDGTILKSIHVKHINRLRVVLPPHSVAARIEADVDPLSRRLAANDQESRTLTALRDTLLPKLISGEVRVPEAEAQVEAVG